MTPVNVGDVFKVTFVTSCDGQLGLNVKQFRVESADVPSADLQGLLNGICDEIAIRYTNILTNTATFRGAYATPLPNLVGVAPTISTNSAGAGTAGGNPLPMQVTGIATLRTTLAGRANRGRIYVPFPPTDALENGTEQRPTVAYKNSVQSLASFFVGLNEITSPDNPAEVWEIRWGLGVGAAFRQFDSAVARQKFATQRRRGNYGRHNEIPF